MTGPNLPKREPGDFLTIGIGTAVAMWFFGYALRLSPAVPPWMLAAALLGCIVAGGYAAGRWAQGGWVAGLKAGLVTATLNLLIIGGVLKDAVPGGDPDAVAPTALGWIPGTMALTAGLMALFAAAGAASTRTISKPSNWSHALAWVALLATGNLLMAGGLVTSREAGLAVPDWPNSFGFNMVLYPLARMTGNIYYEHAHRLYGVLVGLTTILLAVHLWRHDKRRWLGVLGILAVIAVAGQGVMGGLRVRWAETGSGIEVALPENETLKSQVLRVAHGVFGQVFFAVMVAIAVFTAGAWRRAADRRGFTRDADKTIGVVFVLVMLAQLLLGALVRHHIMENPMTHIAGAGVVFIIAVVAGIRAWALHGEAVPVFKKLGIATVILVFVQVGLGIAALVVTRTAGEAAQPGIGDIVITTSHQMVGACLLAMATALMLFAFRFQAGAAPADPEPALSRA